MHLLLRHKPRFLADTKNRLVKPPNSGEKKKNTAKTFLTLKKNKHRRYGTLVMTNSTGFKHSKNSDITIVHPLILY